MDNNWLPILLLLLNVLIMHAVHVDDCPTGIDGQIRFFENFEGYLHNNVSFDPSTDNFRGNNVQILGKFVNVTEGFFKIPTADHIVAIDLHDMEMKYIETGAFSDLKCVQVLDLHQNNLNTFPKAVFNPSDLPRLRSLNLSFNILNDIFPSYFHLLELEVLDLCHNHIKNVEEGSFNHLPKLKELYLKNNPLMHVDFASWALPYNSLMILDISKCRISSLNFDATHIYHYFTRFMISGNRLTNLDVPGLMRMAPKLAVLQLAPNPFPCNSIDAILDQLYDYDLFYRPYNSTNLHVEGVDCIEVKNKTIIGPQQTRRDIIQTLIEQNSKIFEVSAQLKIYCAIALVLWTVTVILILITSCVFWQRGVRWFELRFCRWCPTILPSNLSSPSDAPVGAGVESIRLVNPSRGGNMEAVEERL